MTARLPYRLAMSEAQRLHLVDATAAAIRDALVAKALRLLADGPMEGRSLAQLLCVDARALDILLRACPSIAKTHRRSTRSYGVAPHRHFPVCAWYGLIGPA